MLVLSFFDHSFPFILYGFYCGISRFLPQRSTKG